MTDKEIIIDGVNVARCDKQGETQAGITCGTPERIRFGNEYVYKHTLCKDNSNCLYKQLRRKEQECEELKRKVNNYEIYGSPVVVAPQNHTNTEFDLLLGKYLRYKQALEKIEEYWKNHIYIGWANVEGIMKIINEVKE